MFVCVRVGEGGGDRAAFSKRIQGDSNHMHHVFQDLMKKSLIITLDVIIYSSKCNV